MRIPIIGPKQLEEYIKLSKKDEKTSAKKESPGEGAPEDKVRFSESAREVQRMRATLESIPEIRTERIEKLREAIARGQYHVDAKSVAEKLLRESLFDLLL